MLLHRGGRSTWLCRSLRLLLIRASSGLAGGRSVPVAGASRAVAAALNEVPVMERKSSRWEKWKSVSPSARVKLHIHVVKKLQ